MPSGEAFNIRRYARMLVGSGQDGGRPDQVNMRAGIVIGRLLVWA
jgi:hypothetical protein